MRVLRGDPFSLCFGRSWSPPSSVVTPIDLESVTLTFSLSPKAFKHSIQKNTTIKQHTHLQLRQIKVFPILYHGLQIRSHLCRRRMTTNWPRDQALANMLAHLRHHNDVDLPHQSRIERTHETPRGNDRVGGGGGRRVATATAGRRRRPLYGILARPMPKPRRVILGSAFSKALLTSVSLTHRAWL